MGEGQVHVIDADVADVVLADADMVALEPDPKSRMGASRFIGHSLCAGRVLVVIAYRDLDGELSSAEDPRP